MKKQYSKEGKLDKVQARIDKAPLEKELARTGEEISEDLKKSPEQIKEEINKILNP